MRLVTTITLLFLVLAQTPVVGQEQDDDLIAAALAGDADAVRLALANGADVNTVSQNRASLLLMAAASNHVELVAFLLAQGADPNLANAQGATPLFAVSQIGHANVVELLLDHGADANIALDTEDSIYPTPLMIAVINNRTEVVRVLLRAGADASFEHNDGYTVNDVVDRERQPEIANLLDRSRSGRL